MTEEVLAVLKAFTNSSLTDKQSAMVRKSSVTGEILIPLVNISLEDIRQAEKTYQKVGSP